MTNRMISVLSFLLLLGGCYATTDEAEVGEIGAALELDNGGLDMEDELPTFGMEERFEELALLEADLPVTDPMEADSATLAITSVPEAVAVNVAIVWGQIPGDRTNEVPHDWSGVLAVNRGALIARRTVMFEPVTDRLLPRPNPQVLPFTSATLPHHDGLVITIVDPTPEAPEPLILTYVADLPGPAGSEGGTLRVPLRAILGGPTELASDPAGNRMVAAAHARPIDVCQHGFTMGRWHRVAEGRGRLVGRVVGADGELLGHMRGIYGVRASGEQVFFGKYINTEGRFRGIFAGRYDDGHFEGRWITRDGERGGLGGEYREQIPGPETGGHFLGRWGEATCDVRL